MKRFLTKEKLTSGVAILIYLMVVNFIFHTVTGWQYGYFRDEFYYMSMTDHIDLGYVDITPIAAWIMALTKTLFGTSINAIHIFPAIAGSFTVLFAGLTAKKMGGGRFAMALTAIAVMAAPMYMATAGFFSYDVFDQLMSAIVIFLLVKILNGEFTHKTWILLGFMIGIGLMVKITFGLMVVALVIGLLFTRRRSLLANKWPWVAAAIALACFVPYIIWQAQRGFPFLQYLGNYAVYRSTHPTPWVMLNYIFLVMNPVSVLLWLGGLVILFKKRGRAYRPFVWAFIFFFIVAVVFGVKYYAFAGLMIPLTAFGAVCFERGYRKEQPDAQGVLPVKKERLAPRIVYIAVLCFVGLFAAPDSVAVLSKSDYIAYNNTFHLSSTVKSEDTEVGLLPQHYADRSGWEELTQAVSQAYHSLTEDEQKYCSIIAKNYGEAGALGCYAGKYGIPTAISPHLSFYYWGYGDYDGRSAIFVGYPDESRKDAEKYFTEVKTLAVFHNDYIMPYENDNPIFLCRGLKGPVEKFWEMIKDFG